MTRVDIIAAVRNEEQTIPAFLAAMTALELPADVSLGVIFVEDSSTDGTKQMLRDLARSDPRIHAYLLVRGYGQGPAIAFGLTHSSADAMIMMDVDGSHPVAAIPEMVRAFLDGAQVVQCLRRSLANRAAYRGAGSALFFRLATLVTGVNLEEQKVYFRLVSADIARWILKTPRYWHYLRFPLTQAGPGTLRFIAVDTEERTAGESKYGPLRLLKMAADGVLSVIAPGRFVLLSGLLMLGGLCLLPGRAWIAGALVLVAAVAGVRRYQQLGRGDLLQAMVLEESSDTPRT